MTESDQIAASIAALETQRAVLGDAVTDTALASLKEKLAALGAHSQPAQQQLKQVTVLFADVVDSTRLSQHLDPEDMLAVMEGALRRFAASIERHGGRVLQFAGDGLHAAFGAETTREDDPERAVRAGLALLTEAKLHAAEVATKFAIPDFAIRVGINTGPVLMGGGLDADKTAMGLAINVARRMEESAPVGGLRMSHDTYRHIRGVFDVAEETPLVVKGVDEPMRTYLVLRAKPRAFRNTPRGIEGIETRMVGRDRELGQIQETFDAVLEDKELALVTVVAEAGLGKSRLLYEFDNWLELRPEKIWLFRGRAYPQSAGQPYGLLRDLFAWRFQIQDSDSLEQAREKLRAGIAPWFGPSGDEQTALLGHLIGLDYSASPHIAGILQDAKQIRDRAFHAAAQYFRRLSQGNGDPVAILLDDLHWADDGSLDFVNYLAEVAHDLPILVVCLARPVLFERRPRWGSGQAAHERIELTPLGKRGSRELAEALLQRLAEVPQVLRELITGGAEGNPFYMEELTKMLIDDGVIVTGPEQWRVAPERLVKVHIPATLTGVLQARLDALPREEKTALQQAAVVGHVFWDEAVAAIHTPSKAALPALARRELVFGRETTAVDEAGEYVFKHHVLHQVTYDSVLKRDRRDYHQKTGDWLATKSGARVSEYLGLIADHYERAGDTVNAAAYLRRAGEDAAQRYANDAALQYLNRALALTPEADVAGRFALLLAREAVFDLQGARPAQRADLDALETLADHLDDDALRAEVAARRAQYSNSVSDYPGAIEAARRAVALAEAAGVSTALRANRVWGWALMRQGDYAGAQVRADANLATARASGDRRAKADALRLLAAISGEQGNATAQHHFHEQCLQINRSLGDRRREASDLNNLGDAEMRLGNYPAAATWLEQSLHLARSLGHREGECVALANLALVAHSRGDHEAAMTYGRQSVGIARTIDAREREAFAMIGIGHALAALLRHAEAVEAYDAALALWREMGAPNIATEPLAGLARVKLAEGNVDQARAHVEDILTHLATGGSTDGTDEPLRIYLTCFQVLEAAHDPRADALLTTMHAMFEQRAAKITDPDAQRMFRHDIAHNREIASAWAERHGSVTAKTDS
jgi:class 3 adenylate cyclase/tetratricopeptide (TPR) repeat protein